MDTRTTGIRPENLTPKELAQYAWLHLTDKGLDKAWAEALIKALEKRL